MRKKLSYIILIFIIIFIGYFSIFPFIFKSDHVRNYCNSVKVNNLDIKDLKLDIRKNNLNFIEDISRDNIIVYDKDTMGRFTCNIDYSSSPIKITYQTD